LPGGAIAILAAWIGYVRDQGPAIADPAAAELARRSSGSVGDAVLGLLGYLDPGLPADPDLVTAVLGQLT
jgi:hypothetical protein